MRARPEMMMTGIFFIGPPIFGLVASWPQSLDQ